jgi:hypothetical protein
MFRAMTLKELREIGGILLLALAAYVYPVTSFMGCAHLPWVDANAEVTIPFVRNDLIGAYEVISCLLAVALGFRQTLGESIGGTYPFLLHRPASRRWLLGMKLLTGATAFLVCAALPVLVCAIWAATPGTHPGPFEWSMTFDAWNAWWRPVILYFAAFLCGIRPSRWLGTRLAPMVAAGIVFALANEHPFSLLARSGLLLLANALMLMAICFVTRHRDF